MSIAIAIIFTSHCSHPLFLVVVTTLPLLNDLQFGVPLTTQGAVSMMATKDGIRTSMTMATIVVRRGSRNRTQAPALAAAFLH